MKRQVCASLLLTSLLLIVFCSGIASAQSQWCPSSVPDCPNDPWNYGGVLVYKIVNSNGDSCEVRAVWCYRTACGSYYDYWVSKYEWNPQCFAGEDESVVRSKILKGFHRKNPAGFPCGSAHTPGEVWRFYSAMCYQETVDQETGNKTIESCPDYYSYCYKKYITSCDPQTGEVIATLDAEGVFNPGSCPCTSGCVSSWF